MSETEHTDQVEAYQTTPSGAIIRLRGEETENGWVEHIETVTGSRMRNGRVVSDDEEVTVLYTGTGMQPTQVYNDMIHPYLELELEAARERRDEAKAQGDTIEAFAAVKYIRELKEQLGMEEEER